MTEASGVVFWKQMARKWEDRAKYNATEHDRAQFLARELGKAVDRIRHLEKALDVERCLKGPATPVVEQPADAETPGDRSGRPGV